MKTTSTAAVYSEPAEPAYGSFISGVALTFTTRVLMLAGVFGSGVLAARWLSAARFGTYAVLNVTVALALQIGSAGLPSANTFFLSRERKNLGPIWANAILFAAVAGTGLAASVVALAWFWPALFGGISIKLLAIGAASIPFQLLTLLGLNVLLAADRIRQMNLFDSLAPALVLLNAIVVLVILRKQLAVFVSFNTAASIVLGLALALFVGRLVRQQREQHPTRPDFQLLSAMLRYGVKFYISIMVGAIIFRADLLIVNHYRGASAAGVYAVASQFSFLLLMLPGVIATLLFPRVAASQDDEGEFAARVTRHTTVVMFFTCMAGAGVSPLLPVIYGQSFADATIQLLILLPGIFLVGLESVLVQHFTGTGLPAAIPLFWIVTLAFNLGSNLIAVPRFGARGAAVTSTLSYGLIFLCVTIYFCVKTRRGPGEVFLLRGREWQALTRPGRWLTSPTKAPQ